MSVVFLEIFKKSYTLSQRNKVMISIFDLSRFKMLLSGLWDSVRKISISSQ